jgi:uncharacterized membrane protein YqaE (UPF0057 family)
MLNTIEHFYILNPFEPFTDAVVSIANGAKKMLDLVVIFLELFPNLLQAAINIFKPDKIIDDVIWGVSSGIAQLFRVILEKLDFSQSKADNKGDGGPFGVTEKKQAICVSPSFINLMILVLCPPLAMFLHKGIKGWFLTMICALMTYFLYYFPGFVFAALHILC